MESPGKVIAAFIGVFAAGAVFGGFFTVAITSRTPAPATQVGVAPSAPAPATPSPTAPVAPASSTPAAAAPTSPAAAAQHPALLQLPMTWQAPQLMRRYAERLDLTPEQKEHITPLIQRAIEDYRRVQQTTFRETGIILQRLQQDIGRELTPEQKAKLAAMEERQRELLQKMEQRRTEQQRKGGKAQEKALKNGGDRTSSPAPSSAATAAPSEPTPSTTASTSSADSTPKP